MSKIVVDELPVSGKECPFVRYEYDGSTQCAFQSGKNDSRCDVDCGMDCPYLTTAEIIERDRSEAALINKMIEMTKMTPGHMPVKED